MKKLICVLLIIMLAVFAAGCGSEGKDDTVDDVDIQAEDNVEAEDAGTVETDDGESSGAEAESGAESDSSVDVDLTALNATMVYGQVYDMMTRPEDFKGKTVKMGGQFAVYTDETNGNNYFACIIKDATACCSQGLEFQLEGDHTYPDDYPDVGTDITVIGTFDTYTEYGNEYCTLTKAKII